METLGISLAVMGVISVAIFQFAIKGGVGVSTEGGHVKIFKGEEYETVLTIESRATEWMGWMPPTVKIETGQLLTTEPLAEGTVRLRFLGTYAGRSEDIQVKVSLTDPLKLLKRLEQVVYGDFVLDTLPLSLLAPPVPRRLTISGFGDQPTGHPGPGHELYGLDEYHSGDTKDIIWKRVAKSPDEKLTARVREANVREVVRVGVVHFAERGDERAAWIDVLCEAMGHIGKEVFEMGSAFAVLYHSPPEAEGRSARKGGERRHEGLTQARATDVVELAEVMMSWSAASGSRDIVSVVSNSDFVITGLKELEDETMARLIAEKPMLLISEGASPPTTFSDRSMIYSGRENLFPLIRKILER
jgi:hypothetical protein